jgi:hypothetical protein
LYACKNLELQTYLVCHDHPGQQCYKPVGVSGSSRPLDHIQLDPPAIRDWTTAILNDSATINCPPHSLEFKALLYNNGYPRSKSSMSTPLSAQTPLPIIIQLPDQNQSCDSHSLYRYNMSPSTPQTPQRRRPVHRHALASSPLVDHRAFDDYNGDGLMSFIKWLEHKYKVKRWKHFFSASVSGLI